MVKELHLFEIEVPDSDDDHGDRGFLGGGNQVDRFLEIVDLAAGEDEQDGVDFLLGVGVCNYFGVVEKIIEESWA